MAKQTYSAWYDKRLRRVRDFFSGETRIYLEIEIRWVLCWHYDKVKREQLDFLANNPLCTKRFAWYVGRRCRSSTVSDIACELNLDWRTVKELDMEAILDSSQFGGSR